MDPGNDEGNSTDVVTGETGTPMTSNGPATEDAPTSNGPTDPATSNGPTNPATTDTTIDPETTDPTADTTDPNTTSDETTEVCTPGTTGCPCDGGSCDAGLECTGGVCLSPNCGNGVVDPGEQCDAGGDNGPSKACLDTCVLNKCGDGDKGPGEDCDDGPANDEDAACLDTCELATCGDGLVWAGHEECDDGNQNGNDLDCTSMCKIHECGDGFVHYNEDCDNGNQNGDTKACKANCEVNVCGDGDIEIGVEECDDANLDYSDGCTPDCEIIPTSETINLTNLNKAIPDAIYNGTQGTMACVDLVATLPLTVSSLRVTLAMDHTYLDDLVIKLYSPDNAKVLAMLSRPGQAEAADNGNVWGSENSNISKTYPITFSDAGEFDAENMGFLLGDAQVVCKDDSRCDYFPNKGACAGLTDFSGFSGLESEGTWKLCVGDSIGQFTGIIHSVKLEINVL